MSKYIKLNFKNRTDPIFLENKLIIYRSLFKNRPNFRILVYTITNSIFCNL